MGANSIKTIGLLIMLCSLNGFAQDITVDDIAKVFGKYQQDELITVRKENLTNKIAESDGKKKTRLEKSKNRLTYNPKMMNMFIANNISNYLSSSKDISLQKYYAILESGDGSLFIGYNFMFRKRSIERLKNIGNIGLKTNAEKNFSEILVEDQINPELGLNLKYTYIFPGKINFTKNQGKMLRNYKDNYLKNKYEESLKKYDDYDSDVKCQENTELEAKLVYVTNLKKEEANELINDEYYNQYEKIAIDEEKFINENKLFKSIVSSWITLEAYIPLRDREYKISPDVATFATSPERFYNFSSSFTATRMQKWSNKNVIYSSLVVGAFNTNNIITKELTAYKFETIQDQVAPNQTTIQTVDAYVGNYKEDFSLSLKGEFVSFLVKDIVGLSVSYELVIGDLSSQNWKFGIPISLKDKDDKPSINFEIQYKELNKKHFVGISVGYAFGRFFK